MKKRGFLIIVITFCFLTLSAIVGAEDNIYTMPIQPPAENIKVNMTMPDQQLEVNVSSNLEVDSNLKITSSQQQNLSYERNNETINIHINYTNFSQGLGVNYTPPDMPKIDVEIVSPESNKSAAGYPINQTSAKPLEGGGKPAIVVKGIKAFTNFLNKISTFFGGFFRR